MRFLDVRRAFAVAVLAFASATNVATAGERIEKVCAYSNNAVGIATATGSGVVAAAGGIASALGWGAVAHSSGAAIATASGSYVAGTLGVGGTVLAVVTAPATIAAATATAVAAGGTIAYCHFKHPEAKLQKDETNVAPSDKSPGKAEPPTTPKA